MAGLVGSTRKLSTRDGRTFIAAEIQDLSGGYEVTVWPDVYERTQDFWLPGSILLMQVLSSKVPEYRNITVPQGYCARSATYRSPSR